VWDQVQNLINVSWPTRTWTCWIEHMTTIKGRTLKTLLTKLVFITSVYQVWIERNARKFKHIACPVSIVVSKIYSMVRWKLLSMGDLPHGTHYNWLVTKWNLIA
jgi:hypothetical protein